MLKSECVVTYKREIYIYIENGKIEYTEGLRSSKPFGILTISSDSEIHIMEVDE